MLTTAMVRVPLDQTVKQEASVALDAMGLSVSGVVRALLVRVAAEKSPALAVRVANANANARASMTKADAIMRRSGTFHHRTGLLEPLDAACR